MKPFQHVACFHRNKGLWCPRDLTRNLLQTLGRPSVTAAYPITSCLFKAVCPFFLCFLFLALTQLFDLSSSSLLHLLSEFLSKLHLLLLFPFFLLLHPLLQSLSILHPTIFATHPSQNQLLQSRYIQSLKSIFLCFHICVQISGLQLVCSLSLFLSNSTFFDFDVWFFFS